MNTPEMIAIEVEGKTISKVAFDKYRYARFLFTDGTMLLVTEDRQDGELGLEYLPSSKPQ